METFLLAMVLIVVTITHGEDIMSRLVRLKLRLKGFNVRHSTCKDCGMDCRKEMYMVHDSLWKKANRINRTGMLCVGCLEDRIGRKLVPSDFSDFKLNRPNYHDSERLKSRKMSGDWV